MLHFNQTIDKGQLECYSDDVIPGRICTAKGFVRVITHYVQNYERPMRN